eukprot:TRINITY_DN52048_c0_g1_i1.p1 TRINITY_DN52048_c0_g1~~TRINITY_DN52048_c0_g1_i1.p1  ORF type:complete len:396 (-),score=57.07 TRINITY_DN52048_c0_g1_i1:229-1335(-)
MQETFKVPKIRSLEKLNKYLDVTGASDLTSSTIVEVALCKQFNAICVVQCNCDWLRILLDDRVCGRGVAAPLKVLMLDEVEFELDLTKQSDHDVELTRWRTMLERGDPEYCFAHQVTLKRVDGVWCVEEQQLLAPGSWTLDGPKISSGGNDSADGPKISSGENGGEGQADCGWERQEKSYLGGYPPALGPNSFGTLKEAQAACENCGAGGITQTGPGQFEVRDGRVFKDSPGGETAWLRWECRQKSYLGGYPPALGPNSFATPKEAQVACRNCGAGGITQTGPRQFEVRDSHEFNDSPSGEISWLRPTEKGDASAASAGMAVAVAAADDAAEVPEVVQVVAPEPKASAESQPEQSVPEVSSSACCSLM